MKKILLSAVALASVLAMNAQCDETIEPGFGSSVVFDDFESSNWYGTETGGLFWFGIDKNGSLAVIDTTKRINGSLNFNITQAARQFEPIGMAFGDSNGDGTGTAFTQDFSSDLNYSIGVTNSSANDIKVRLAVQDVNGKVADINSTGTDAAPFNGQIEVTVAAGATEVLEGTFEDGGSGLYDEQSCLDRGVTPASNADGTAFSCVAKDVDFTQISSVNVTVINTEVDTDFLPLELIDANVLINHLTVGSACVNSVFGSAEKASFQLFPNPASDRVNFSKEVNNIVVFDATGNIVLEQESATSLNTSNLESGLYMISTDQGSSKLIVE